MIEVKTFEILDRGIVINDNGEEISIKNYDEIECSDFMTVRYFKHKMKSYLLISEMIYHCQLIYNIKEIDLSIALEIEKYFVGIKDCEFNNRKHDKHKVHNELISFLQEVINGYRTISSEDAAEIIDNRKILGKFLINKDAGRDFYTAIDNSRGDAFTELFETKYMAIAWLLGKDEPDIKYDESNNYSISVKEVLQRQILIDKNTVASKEEAIDKVKSMYIREEIVLDYNDLAEYIIG